MTTILLLCVLCSTSDDHGVQKGDWSLPWHDAVSYRMPEDPATRNRLTRAADWLMRHRVFVSLPDAKFSVPVIAWKDPTLEPADPKLLAGYVITDTLWSAKALNIKQRLWDAQTESGGVAHFVDVRAEGDMTNGRDPTGEATAIAILAEVVTPGRPAPNRNDSPRPDSPLIP